ncbi:MAG TPA: type I DNA topoisomerase [Patescibacteria group bacterium]|nr:type I DNA topoisomerase [Patescibacteria group bacterium]
MNLIIVESPTKARTLGKFLGEGFDVEATTGHIKDLPKSTLGIDIEHDFAPDYVDVVKRKDTIALLKSKAKKAKEIYIATDPDREGEAIASHVEEILSGHSKTLMHRISFHEITKEAVDEAIKNPHAINKDLVDAQIGRRVLDRLVGYKLSPLLWKKVRRGLSAGRVQSVAVRLIVEKEREIEKFKPEEYWDLFSIVKSSKEKKEFTVQLVKEEVKDKKTADEILKDLKSAKYKVNDVRKRQVTKNPYPPFTTSTMTQAASRIMGWSSKKTMSVAQKLYEEGLITYHRTDSLNLSLPAVMKARDFIKKDYGVTYLPEAPRFYKTTNKSAQEAHEAIRPTSLNAKLEKTDDKFFDDEQKLYELIWGRFVACQMNPSIYDETSIDVEADKHILRASGQIMKFDGWRRIVPAKKNSEEEIVVLPDVEKGEDLDLVKTWGDQKFTLPPARYNEASLIKTLEKLGIGRPSTYAPTISVIQIRSYVEKNDNKQFVPTSVGIAVNDFLMMNFPETFDYQFTADMESDLDRVAEGKLPWVKTIKDFWKPFEKKLVDVEKNSKRVKIEVEKLGIKCPDCKEGELVIRTGRFGKFISCSRFPDCKHTEKYLEKIGVKCPECKVGDVIVKKSKKGKFFGCSRYPECKYASWRSPKKEEASV